MRGIVTGIRHAGHAHCTTIRVISKASRLQMSDSIPDEKMQEPFSEDFTVCSQTSSSLHQITQIFAKGCDEFCTEIPT